jgi:molybdate transport system substrate-binding protein
MNLLSLLRKPALLVLLSLAPAAMAHADDVVVMTSGAFTAAYLELGKEFERTTKHRLITATTSMGAGAESIPARLLRGEPADVVIVAADALEGLIRDGTVARGSRVDLAESAIGMAVRSGARKPDISTVYAFRQTLLDAKSVAYSVSVSGNYLINEIYPLLGITEQLMPKSQRIERGRVGTVVARGDAEIGFQQLSELLPVEGVDVVGPLPPALQKLTIFAAGIASASRHEQAARALVAFLASPAAADAVKRSGMVPLSAN